MSHGESKYYLIKVNAGTPPEVVGAIENLARIIQEVGTTAAPISIDAETKFVTKQDVMDYFVSRSDVSNPRILAGRIWSLLAGWGRRRRQFPVELLTVCLDCDELYSSCACSMAYSSTNTNHWKVGVESLKNSVEVLADPKTVLYNFGSVYKNYLREWVEQL